MVHLRLNEREINPNPHINFITPLPTADQEAQEDARQLLRALAAQVRPVMKAHGFSVNSFEEYEHNKVFAGRNWNAGEVVELVLRGASGAFLPVSWLMSTLCHELAHINHMNHGPAFQALWAKLRTEVRELQSKGYYGDGYWSSGTRLMDSARVGGQSLAPGELPEYMCGGAHNRARPTSLRRRRNRQPAGPSNHTGAQTAKKRKAGSRVTASGTFKGSGRALNEDASDDDGKKGGTGFRKKAGSKRAREERALAAERRLRALQSQASSSSAQPFQQSQGESEDDGSDTEAVQETDQDRRRVMLDSMDGTDLENLKAAQTDFSTDFMFPVNDSSLSRPLFSEEPEQDDDIHILSMSGATAAGGSSISSTKRDGKWRKTPQEQTLEDCLELAEPSASSSKKNRDVPYGALLKDEIELRKRESLGMTGSGQRLGGNRRSSNSTSAIQPGQRDKETQKSDRSPAPPAAPERMSEWTCLVCTLSNSMGHLACTACATPRGETTWTGNAT